MQRQRGRKRERNNERVQEREKGGWGRERETSLREKERVSEKAREKGERERVVRRHGVTDLGEIIHGERGERVRKIKVFRGIKEGQRETMFF